MTELSRNNVKEIVCYIPSNPKDYWQYRPGHFNKFEDWLKNAR